MKLKTAGHITGNPVPSVDNDSSVYVVPISH